jgi:AmiR/NasT family two-component response regulator
MRRGLHIPDLGQARALILHRPHPTVQALSRQLQAIGLAVVDCWPEPGPGILGFDYVFFDADMGYDGQFPWPPTGSPMPLIALIGSEAPGRIEWALAQGAHAQLLKPVGDGGAFSALLIARQTFEARAQLTAEISDLRARLADRQILLRAVTLLMAQGLSEAEAYGQLRSRAMAQRETVEQTARRVLARLDGEGGAYDRSDSA